MYAERGKVERPVSVSCSPCSYTRSTCRFGFILRLSFSFLLFSFEIPACVLNEEQLGDQENGFRTRRAVSYLDLK